MKTSILTKLMLILYWTLLLLPTAPIEVIPASKALYSSLKSNPDKTLSLNELKIEASVKPYYTNYRSPGLALSSFFYCLGTTKVQIMSADLAEIKIVTAKNIVLSRDKLNQKTGSRFWTRLTNILRHRSKLPTNSNLETYDISLSPYEDTFVSIQAGESYTLKIVRYRVSAFNVMCLVVGIGLFHHAPAIAEQAMVWYIGGISMSMLLGVVLLAYLVISRVMPKRDSIIVLGFIGSITAWFEWLLNGFIRHTVVSLAKTHWVYLVLYCTLFGLVGFIYCYIKGPPTTNPRAITVLQISLQICSSALIYMAFFLPEAGITTILVVILGHIFTLAPDTEGNSSAAQTEWKSRRKVGLNVSASALEKTSTYVRTPTVIIPKKRKSMISMFRKESTPKPFRRLMKEDEYLEQGFKSTEHELGKLRSFCNSPGSSPWKQIETLKDPKRFAKFINGSPHVSELELSTFEKDLDQLIDDGSMSLKSLSDAEMELDQSSKNIKLSDTDDDDIQNSKENHSLPDEQDSQAESPVILSNQPKPAIITKRKSLRL